MGEIECQRNAQQLNGTREVHDVVERFNRTAVFQ